MALDVKIHVSRGKFSLPEISVQKSVDMSGNTGLCPIEIALDVKIYLSREKLVFSEISVQKSVHLATLSFQNGSKYENPYFQGKIGTLRDFGTKIRLRVNAVLSKWLQI